MRNFLVCSCLVLAACGGAPEPGDAGLPDAAIHDPMDAGAADDAGAHDAGDVDAGSGDAGAPDGGPVDAGMLDAGQLDAGQLDAGVVTNCPTSGMGAIQAPAGCMVFSPANTGASPQGDNASELHYALEPAGTPRGVLLVYFNASLATPARQIPDPVLNFYNAAANAGFHVLALAYPSRQVLGITCNNDAPCFAKARKTIIRGVPEVGVATSLASIQEDEGVVWRLDAALRWLGARRPGQGWDAFLTTGATPEARLVTSRMATAGHSQGGGHAAFFAKLYPVTRVVQLSSTCDVTGTTPAPWTADGQWMTSPATAFVGFATDGDTTCPGFRAVWGAMGLDVSRQLDDAAVCVGANSHTGSINCPSNYARWLTLF